jgi:hypothetical protein
MGECFNSFQKGFSIQNTTNDSIYYPERALSSHQGYKLDKKFEDYLTRSGGSMTGTLLSCSVVPTQSDSYDMGSPSKRYNSVYSNNFIGTVTGTATSATKFSSMKTIELTGAVTGSVNFDASQKIVLATAVNHNHDLNYLKLSGGNMTGNIRFINNSTGILKADGTWGICIDGNGSMNVGNLGSATYVMSYGGVAVNNQAGNLVVRNYSAGGNYMEVGVGVGDTFLHNGTSGAYLQMSNDGYLRYNNNPVYHTGYKPSAADVGALPTSGGTMTGRLYTNEFIQFNTIEAGILDRFGRKAFTTFSYANNVAIGYGMYDDPNDSTSTCNIYGNGIEIRPGVGDVRCDGHFIPWTSGSYILGASNKKWKEVYANSGSINTSDRKLKNTILSLTDKYEQLFFGLKPVVYKFNNGESNRFHVGYVAQDIEKTMYDTGLTSTDFAGLCKTKLYRQHGNPYVGMSEQEARDKNISLEDWNKGSEFIDINTDETYYDYALRYEEFISLNTHMIQKLYARIDEIEVKLSMKDNLEFTGLGEIVYDKTNLGELVKDNEELFPITKITK